MGSYEFSEKSTVTTENTVNPARHLRIWNVLYLTCVR